jgi:hypothetical protein
MINSSLKPFGYVNEPAEVYLSYTTSEGVKVEHRVFLDTAVEVINPQLHLYDVIDKWVLALPGAYHELTELQPGELTNWENFIQDELIGTDVLKGLKLLNRSSTPCTVKLKNKFGESRFNSYLARNLYSLVDEGVYAVGANTLTPIMYPGSVPTQNLEGNDLHNYLPLIKPLLCDIRVLAQRGYPGPKDYAITQHEGTVVLRLLCSGTNIREPNSLGSYTLALEPLRDFLTKFLPTTFYSPKLFIHDAVVYMNRLGLAEAGFNIVRLNKFHKFVQSRLTGIEPEISDDPNERTIQLLKGTEKLAQSKKYIVDLFFRGVNMFYMDGQILVNSVKHGSDYMLRLMSLIPGRLITFLSYAKPATKLLFAALNENSNPIALEYILIHDTRAGRVNSISYKKLLKKLPAHDIYLATYIRCKGPMYRGPEAAK